MKKIIVFGVIALFVGVSITTSTGRIDTAIVNINDGSLLGYVNDTSGNPIEGALVRVFFHGTYEEDYSDSNGFYHVTNIPICWCYKNCTASKEGYETDWVLLGIYENTTYDFVLTPLTQYNGSLSGYVFDTGMNPIEEALVRVHFHGTYREDYSDSMGYYHVINIPICYCLKNATCSKEGYKTEWVLLGIVENTTYDFVLTSENQPPDKPIIRGKWAIHEPRPYDYKFKAIDPDGDDISYLIDWDDGTTEWTDYYASGEEMIVSHTWSMQGTIQIRARANDTHGALGPWGKLELRSKSTDDNNEIEQMDNNKEIITQISGYVGLDYCTSEGILLKKVELWTMDNPYCYLEITGYKRPLFPLDESKFNANPTHIIAERFFGFIGQSDDWYYSVSGFAIGNIDWE